MKVDEPSSFSRLKAKIRHTSCPRREYIDHRSAWVLWPKKPEIVRVVNSFFLPQPLRRVLTSTRIVVT